MIAVFAAILTFSGVVSVSAADMSRRTQTPDESYNYTAYGESIAAPAAYMVSKSVELPQSLNAPADLFVSNNMIYVLDSGNERIVVLDENYEQLREIKPVYENGIKDAYGLYIHSNGNIYITLPEQKRIIVCDQDGQLLQTIEEPKSPLIPSGTVYKPKRLVITNDDVIYLVAEGIYYGIMQLDINGNFLSFYGANTVEPGLENFLTNLYNKIFTNEMKSKVERRLPFEYASIDIDQEGFVYSAVATDVSSNGQIKKHNPGGDNILGFKDTADVAAGVKLFIGDYGDLETNLTTSGYVTSVLSDLAVDKDGYLFILDTSRNKVFQYDQNNNLLSVFGTQSDDYGALQEPTAVDTFQDDCLVLDKKQNALLVYSMTDYGALLKEACGLYNEQKYEEADELWQQVIQMNNNLVIAHDGIGKAAFGRSDYKTAMEHFELAGNKLNYNEAFSAYRDEIMIQISPYLFTAVGIGLVALWVVLSRTGKRVPASGTESKKGKKITPLRTMIHPFDGYETIKYEKRGSILYANIILLLLFLVRIFSLQFTGFLFSSVNRNSINIFYELFQMAAIFLVVTVCSQAMSTFIDGESFYRETYIAVAYSLLPYVIISFVSTILSMFFTNNEALLLSTLNQIGVLWTGLVMFIGLMKVNRYSFKKTLLSILLIIIAILFVIFLLVLAYSLVMQFVSFIQDLGNEIQYRT